MSHGWENIVVWQHKVAPRFANGRCLAVKILGALCVLVTVFAYVAFDFVLLQRSVFHYFIAVL